MPIKIGTTDIEQVYLEQPIYVLYTGTKPAQVVLFPPEGTPCETLGQVVSYDGSKFECTMTPVEMMEVKQGTTTVHKRVTVYFDGNGGSRSPISKKVTNGYIYGTLATASRTNYTFLGWYTAASGGTKIESTTIVSAMADHTLYAQWSYSGTVVLNPSIDGDACWQYGSIYEIGWRAKNNHPGSVTIYSEWGDSTPDVSKGTVLEGGYSDWDMVQFPVATFSNYIYIQARKLGLTNSAVISKRYTQYMCQVY